MAKVPIGSYRGNKSVNERLVPFIRRRSLIHKGAALPPIGTIRADKQLKADECVMFLPDIAYQQADGRCVASIQAWVYEKQRRHGLTRVLALLLGIDISTLREEEKQLFYERTQLFRVDCGRGKNLVVIDEAGQRHALPKTNLSGRANQIIALPYPPLPTSFASAQQGQRLRFYLDGEKAANVSNEAQAFFAPPEGLSIISDIDDTIKQSFVWDIKRLLRNTFLEHYHAVDGMPAWYQALSTNKNVAFHYVSSSPIQLYPVLDEFMRRENFPEGSVHLREATRWTGVIPRANASKQHKITAIERLLCAYPKRHFILIGDSGEEDSAIYAHCMRHHPNQISAICIRHITGRINPTFFENIFAGLDKKHWLVSHDINQMRQFIDGIVSAHENPLGFECG